MLTRIVRPSPALQAFLQPVTAHLTQPQRQHLLDLADALLVCEDRKTLPALQRQFLDATDPSSWADFLRLSPWSAELLRDALRRRHLAWLLGEAQSRGLPELLSLNPDDSLGKKDRQTSRLEPVDWFHDHNESAPQRPRYHKAFCYLECTAQVGGPTATPELRLSLRAETVRRLNRQRTPGRRLAFRSKDHLARTTLESLRPPLPADWAVYVQFDSWYASERLLKYVRRQGRHAVCAPKSNRKLRGQRLSQFATTLQHGRYTRARVTAADGHAHHLLRAGRRGAVGACAFRCPRDVLQTASRARSRTYFLSTDSARSVVEAPRGYGGRRSSCEVVNFYVETQLGVGAGRLPRAVVRGGGPVPGRRALGLGLRRAALRAGAFAPGAVLRGRNTAASGGAR
jgi:hypothetical protein